MSFEYCFLFLRTGYGNSNTRQIQVQKISEMRKNHIKQYFSPLYIINMPYLK